MRWALHSEEIVKALGGQTMRWIIGGRLEMEGEMRKACGAWMTVRFVEGAEARVIVRGMLLGCEFSFWD